MQLVMMQGGGVKPYVRCPSAMLCVQRVNCDFDGFITEDVLDIGPDLEMLGVPLIVSSVLQRVLRFIPSVYFSPVSTASEVMP